MSDCHYKIYLCIKLRSTTNQTYLVDKTLLNFDVCSKTFASKAPFKLEAQDLSFLKSSVRPISDLFQCLKSSGTPRHLLGKHRFPLWPAVPCLPVSSVGVACQRAGLVLLGNGCFVLSLFPKNVLAPLCIHSKRLTTNCQSDLSLILYSWRF